MFTFIKIAWRNIIRNKKRSSITLSAVGFGLGALIFIWAFVDGAHKQMIENYTSLISGHIQIHAKGFHQKEQLETYITQPEEIKKSLKTNPNILSFTQRIKAAGLVSSSEHSAGVYILGIDPKHENKVSTIYKKIIEGAFLQENSDKEIVLGAGLANNLNVGLGEKIVIMSQALDGSIAAGAFHVKGLLDTGTEEIDKGIVIITHKAAEELFVMQDKTSEIAIRLKNVENAQHVSTIINQKLNSSELEILPWQEVSTVLEQWIEFDNGFVYLIIIVVMIVVAIGILNTVLMGVLERTREFGILLALGTKRKQILAMVAWESLFLGLIGSFFGSILGILLTIQLGKTGIDLSMFSNALTSFYMDPYIYPVSEIGHVVISVSLVLTISVFVSIYPAWHAANLKPVEAIRSI